MAVWGRVRKRENCTLLRHSYLSRSQVLYSLMPRSKKQPSRLQCHISVTTCRADMIAPSLTWRGISESNIIILNRLIKEIVQNDKSPPQLLEAANTILETFSYLKVTVIRFYPPTHVTNLGFFFRCYRTRKRISRNS